MNSIKYAMNTPHIPTDMLETFTLGLIADDTWRSNFTKSFIDYYATDSIKVLTSSSVDDLLRSCETKYLLILKAGYSILTPKFFESLKSFMDGNIVIGNVILTQDDYAQLDDTVLFFNVELWDAAGRPAYASTQGVGHKFIIDEENCLERTGDSAMIKPTDAARGGRLISTQLEKFGKMRIFPASMQGMDFYLENSTPYEEIHFETLFEEQVLSPRRLAAHHDGALVVDQLPSGVADVVVCHGHGLTARFLGEHYKARHIIIFSASQAELDFQKLLFSIDSPTLYGDIVATFQDENMGSLIGDFEEDEFTVVQPFAGDVEYVKAVPIGYQLEELIKKINRSQSAVFCLGELFFSPFNFYKRTKEQVQALFVECFSLIGSRHGASRLIAQDAHGKWYLGDVINGDTTRFSYMALEQFTSDAP